MKPNFCARYPWKRHLWLELFSIWINYLFSLLLHLHLPFPLHCPLPLSFLVPLLFPLPNPLILHLPHPHPLPPVFLCPSVCLLSSDASSSAFAFASDYLPLWINSTVEGLLDQFQAMFYKYRYLYNIQQNHFITQWFFSIKYPSAFWRFIGSIPFGF